ncbi:hypothetical protein [Nocardia sp. NPDC052566]|uniref:hypothetical protein n=1 Tax=Nocardia sp. NPDC052566 TaxID=3364330 RepID=UPI0037C81B35
MGNNHGACVYYGYDLGDLYDWNEFESLAPTWWDEADSRGPDWEAELIQRLGGQPMGYSPEKAALLAAEQAEVASYGWNEEPRWSIRIKASVQAVDDYGSIPLKPLLVAPEWDQQLTRLITLLEFRAPASQPGWHLACDG